MTVNFSEIIKESEGILTRKNLYGILLGSSGAGKSSACGTLPGKILFLCFRGEKHGPRNAAALGGKVIPVVVDVDGGKDLAPDAAYKRLIEILNAPEVSQFQSVVIDGLPELEATIVRTNEFKQGCLSDKGKHNSFAEGRVVLTMLKPILERLDKLYEMGMHIVVTCKVDVRAMDDQSAAITEVIPRLLTYQIAEEVLSKFSEVLLVGRMTNGEVWKHKFQFSGSITRTAKDANNIVKKFLNFSPRIGPIGSDKLPEHMPADFGEVIKMKEAAGVKE